MHCLCKLIFHVCLLFINANLFSLASSIPHTASKRGSPAKYDVLVIGGGPAGLQALSSLGRVRRNALLLDSGDYRNAPTRRAHDVLGFDGTPPAAFRALARQQISKYPTVTMYNATIKTIENLNNGKEFVATDSTGKTYSARKVVLGTGMRDLLPSTPGIAKAWGKGIYWCPWCDGYEHRDQPLGVLGGFVPGVVSKGLTMQTLNKDIILFVNGTFTSDNIAKVAAKNPNWEQELKDYNVIIDDRPLASITRLGSSNDVDPDGSNALHDEFLVTFTDGATIRRSAFVTSFPEEQRSDLGKSLGVEIFENQLVVDSKDMETKIKGIYAVGDANSDGSSNVPHAMWSAKRAVVGIHGVLSDEDAAALVENQINEKREVKEYATILLERDLEDLWEKVSRLS
ncbi:MAG: hypothetical protein M1833_005283 [Piccolia ochrophora]|nr:MAG: hypothetical protein M1833_005283 [Piccolia ochrophora]